MKNGSVNIPCQSKLASRVLETTTDTEMMSDPDLYITDSCEPVLWNCTARTTLIDPCSCDKYYECRGHGNGIVERTCPSGTAYDHQTKTCPNRVSVVPSQCRPSRPWERCNLNGEQSQALLERCENKSLSVTTTTLNPVTKSGEQELNGNEAGFIIGAVFGGLFIIVVAIGITFLFRRCLQKNKTKLTKKRSVQNPEYNFQPEPQMDVEETYHEIDDNMNDPTYSSDSGNSKPPSLPIRSNDTMGGSNKDMGVNYKTSLHNSDTVTSNGRSVQNGTVNIYDNDNGTTEYTENQQESNYIAIFPQNTKSESTREGEIHTITSL